MKMFSGSSFTAAIVVTSFTVLAVQAAEVPVRGPVPFAAYDQDGDGVISEAEFAVVRDKRMASRAGMPGGGAGNMPPFSAFDVDADGRISPDELAAGQQKMRQQHQGKGKRGNMPSFQRFDLNGDGRIPEEEFLKAQRQRISERSQAGYPMRNIGNIAVFSDIDSNGDGAITPDEFSAHQLRHRQQKLP